jgi:uncharacterized lipoprotein YmbA
VENQEISHELGQSIEGRRRGVGDGGLVAALAACSSSPASRFYTLGGNDAATRTAAPASFYLEVSPVDMPPQVAKNQMVVQDGSAQVRVLEDERWASLPADEVRRALSADLSQQLGAIDVYGTPHPESVPVYRVKVNVQRFESSPGRRALIDAVWSVRGVNNEAVLTCRTWPNKLSMPDMTRWWRGIGEQSINSPARFPPGFGR